MPDRNILKQICGISIALLALLAFIIVLLPGTAQEPPSQLASSSEADPTPSAAPTPSPSPTPTPTSTSQPSAQPQMEPEISVAVGETEPESDSPEEVPAYTGPDLEPRERADDEFFADALFVGNSLVHGLWGYGGIGSADYAAATSASIVNLDRVRNEAVWGESKDQPSLFTTMSAGSYDKVYILLGINEIGFETADFISIYSGVLDSVEAAHPEADIYLMGLTPITQEKDAGGYPFTMERVLSYNEALRDLAGERECYYLDLVEALADDSGFLPEADSTDGIHLTREKYPKWAEYIRTHYADNEDE